jgi:hypothetical protein
MPSVRTPTRPSDDGELTRQQADRLVEKLSDALDEFVEERGRPGLDFGFRGPGFGLGPVGPLGPLEKGIFPGADLMETAADYLGMDEADFPRGLARRQVPRRPRKGQGQVC